LGAVERRHHLGRADASRYTGFAWYRKQIQLTGRASGIAVFIPQVEDAYEVFWNGQKIGECGKLPPHAWWWQWPRGVAYPLGTAPLDGVLALRVWKSPPAFTDESGTGGFWATPLIGSPAALTQRELFLHIRHEDLLLPRFILSGALFITGLIALLLFLRERRDFLYLWLALFLIANGFTCFQGLNSAFYGTTFFQSVFADQAVAALQDISLWLLLLTLFDLHRQKVWRRWTIALAAIYLAAMVIDLVILRFWEYAGHAMQLGSFITSTLVAVTRAPQVQREDGRPIPAFHLGQIFFSKWFQRCCRVDPPQRSRASAKCLQALRILFLSCAHGKRNRVITSLVIDSNLSRL